MDFHEIWYLRIFWKSHENSSSLKSDKNNGYFTWRPLYVYLTELVSEWETSVAETHQNLHCVFNNIFMKIMPFVRCAKYGTARQATVQYSAVQKSFDLHADN